jgi:putative membrane protein
VQLPVAHVEGAFEPLQVAPVLAVAALYAVRARSLALSGRPVPGWRQASFALGMLLILIALVSPLAALDYELVWAHMAQHLLLADLGALLVVLGLTGPLLQPLLATRGLGWLRALSQPAIALPLWLADLYLWHVPGLYQAAISSQAVHALEHACFAGFGIAMWMALLGPLPKPDWFGNGARLIYVIVVRFGGAVLANVLLWAGSPLYPDYTAGEATHGISPLADQGAAGVLMMVEQGLVTLGLFAWLFFRAAKQSEERQALLELAAEHGVPLDEARAARAVAAGQGERLRERIATGRSALSADH